MTIRVSQNSFAGGEFSPTLNGRKDIQKYPTALRSAKNFFIHPHGPASNRPGLRYMGKVESGRFNVRLGEFIFSTDDAYILEIGYYAQTARLYVRFYTSDGPVAPASAPAWVTATAYDEGDYVTHDIGGGPLTWRCDVAHTSGVFATDYAAAKWIATSLYEVRTPDQFVSGQISGLKFAQSADTLYIANGSGKPMKLVRHGATDWRFSDYEPEDGPFLLPNYNPFAGDPSAVEANKLAVSAVTGTGINLTVSAGVTPFFTSDFVGRLFKLRHYVQAAVVTGTLAANGTSTSIPFMTGWRITTHGTWDAVVNIEVSQDGGSTWSKVRILSGKGDRNLDTFGTEENPDQEAWLVRLSVTGWVSGTVDYTLAADAYYQEGIGRVTAVPGGTTVTVDVLKKFAAITGTDDWAIGSWGTDAWPSTVAFYQDRLCWGGSDLEPQTLWMSATGDYESFQRSSPLIDSDGITVNLPSRRLNRIQNLIPSARLVVLTSGQPFTVRPGSDGVLSPTSIIIEVAGGAGCSDADAILTASSRVIFVQPMGQIVRDLGYSFQSDNFEGTNLSLFSNHLFRGKSIVDVCIQEEPDNLVWAVSDDGTALALTYVPEEQVLAWTPIETDGEFKSAASIPGDGYNEVWFAILRGATTFIEKLTKRADSRDLRDAFFVDCGTTYDDPKVITGATQASPVVITSNGHGYTNNDLVDISGVEGMLELNGAGVRRFKVAGVTANTFQLKNEDTSANINGTQFSAYTGGGVVRKASTVFGDLTHLEGLEVVALADGRPAGRYTVESSEIELTRAAGVCHVGLPYESVLKTLKPTIPLRDGASQGMRFKTPQIIVSLFDSMGGYVGTSDRRLQKLKYADETALFTGDILTPVSGDSTNDPHVIVKQTDPLPLTVLEITAILDPGGVA